MFKKELKLVAVGAACGAAITVAAVIAARKAWKRHKSRVISRKARKSIIKVLEDVGKEKTVTKVGEALVRHRLNNMSDKELIALYAAVKVAQTVKDSGINPVEATQEQLVMLRERFDSAHEEKRDRDSIIKSLLSHRLEDLSPLLSIALSLYGVEITV